MIFCMYSKAGTAFLTQPRKMEYYSVFLLHTLLHTHALCNESSVETASGGK